MRKAKKLLGTVLGLCLVLSLLTGFTTVAEDENLISYENGWYSTVKQEKVAVSPDGISLPFNYEETADYYELQIPSFSVEQNKTYRLSFEYSLPEGGKLEYRPLPLNASYNSVNSYFSAYKALEGTNGNFVNITYGFTVESSEIAKIEVRFRSTKNAAITESAVLKNVAVRMNEQDDAVTNGSFEMLDGQGAPIDTTGGELITGTGAYDGINMMKVTQSTPLSLTLGLAKVSSLAKLRGFLKAENFTGESKATLSVVTAQGAAVAEKSFNLAPAAGVAEDNIWNIATDTWEYIRMSALPYTNSMKLEVNVTGAGSVYVDGFTFENDKNLVRNAAFVPEGATDANGNSNTWAIELTRLNELLNKKGMNVFLNESYTNPTTNEVIPAVTANGNCPDGQNYIEASGYESGSTSMVLLRTRSPITVQEGEKYRMSLWLKTEGTSARISLDGQTASIKANYPGWNQFIMDVGTNGKWKQVEFTLTVPKGLTSFNLNLRTQGAVSSDKKVSFNMPVVEKISENEVGFYVQEFENAPSDAGGVPVVAPKLERYGYAFQNVLGTPLETATGFTGTITAVAITVAPQVTSDNIVIMAAYAKDRNGSKKLVNVKVGVAPGAPTWTTAVKDAAGNTVTGVNYPSVTMRTDEIGDNVDEIRAFALNNLSDLKPVGKYASITR